MDCPCPLLECDGWVSALSGVTGRWRYPYGGAVWGVEKRDEVAPALTDRC
jgi:hypothetical protein